MKVSRNVYNGTINRLLDFGGDLYHRRDPGILEELELI